jgi:tRNA threonylcarbamoyladenosine biosynthesis protein TsaB
LRATIIDARRGEIYGALYDSAGRAVIDETVIPFPAFLNLLSGREFEWVCADFSPFTTAIAGTLFQRMPIAIAPRALAGAMATIAITRLRSGTLCEAAAIEANYVRRSDAELLWKSF